MKKLKITFETGEFVVARLKQNETANIVYHSLPIESTLTHSRWSGREVNFRAKLSDIPEREDQTIYTSHGDVVYWRDWRSAEESPNNVIAIYYGAELTRSHIGDEPVNIFGEVLQSHFELLKTIGERIWLKGTEKVKVEKFE